MPYTVVIEGVPIQCETAIEAAELARVAGGNTATPAANSTNSNSVQATGPAGVVIEPNSSLV